jgi:hypothetical protein
MDIHDVKIATCSIRAFKNEYGVPLRTTVGLIRNIACESGSKLAPYGLLKIADPDEFAARYIARLDGLADAIEAQLLGVAEKYPGQTIVCLCFEDVRKDLCHREFAAQWLHERWGIDVRELSCEHTYRPMPERETPAETRLF